MPEESEKDLLKKIQRTLEERARTSILGRQGRDGNERSNTE